MSEREPDNTPKPADAPTGAGRRRPGDYYYDDATGYEPYDPAADEDDCDEKSGGGRESVKP
jgi:hypothetical protein